MMRSLANRSPALFIGRRMRRGLTLVECVLALVILPLAVIGVAYAVTAGQMESAESLRSARAAALAEALMEEILSKPFSEGTTFGKEAGETAREQFDDMDDYLGYSEPAGTLRDAGGVAYPAEFQSFSRAATCVAGTVSLTGLGGPTAGLTITVTVSDGPAVLVTLTRFVASPT